MNDSRKNSSNQNSTRAPRPSISLVETRRSNRTFGCVGFSIAAHLAFLAALAVVPEHIRELKSGQDASGVSFSEAPGASTPSPDLVDVSVASASPIEVSNMTDSTSDIVEVKPRREIVVEKAAVRKPVEKVKLAAALPAKAPKARPEAMPEVAPDTQDTLKTETLTDTASDFPSSDDNAVSEDVVPEQPIAEPTVVAEAKIEPDVAADVEPEVVDAESSVTPESTPLDEQTVAAAESIAAPSAANLGQDAPQEKSASGTGSPRDGATTIIGPIRDANDLKALPGNPNPVYPARDRLARRQGTAVILGRVSPEGRITELTLEQSSGSLAMDNASVQAFRSWRFQSGQQGWVRKPFQFRLVGAAKEVPAPLGKQLKR